MKEYCTRVNVCKLIFNLFIHYISNFDTVIFGRALSAEIDGVQQIWFL